MDREQALAEISQRVKNENLVKHMLATEAIMRSLARRLGGEDGEWGLAGLLHDIDVELCGSDINRHSRDGAEIAAALGCSPAIAQAILVHNEAHGLPPATVLEKALFCCDPLTGLIVAAALVRPDKKLEGVTTDTIMKRFKEKRFAAGARREQIALCQDYLGLGLEEFVSLGLEAMKGVAAELGL